MPERVDSATALIPLRIFLGATFVYAGWQKLSDPGFLHPGSTTWIGTQLHGFAAGTPGGFLIRWFAEPFPSLAGVGAALVEIAIGLLVLLGFQTRLAATAGLVLNLTLFLTASWHTYPYFLGSDIVFVFAWLPFVLAGAAGQPALDTMLDRPATVTRRTRDGRVMVSHRMSREQALKRGAALVGGLTLGIAGLATLFRGSYHSTSALGTDPTAATTHPHHHHRQPASSTGQSGGSSSTSAPPASSSQSVPSGAVDLGAVPPGQAKTYTDPQDGGQDIVVRSSSGTLSAVSAVCTHAGCTVQYQGGVLLCPCHGSQFNAETGAVVQGPASTPLAKKQVIQRNGKVYAV